MTSNQPTTSMFLIFVRVFWMGLGPIILTIISFSIISQGGGWFTPADIAFLVVLGALPLARWIEFRRGNPQTSTGEPATPAHLRKYVVGVISLGLAVWSLANLLGN